MATSLGQVNPTASTLTTLYTASKQAVTSTLVICNTGATTAGADLVIATH